MLIDNSPGAIRFNRALQKVSALYPELLIPVGYVRSVRKAPPGVTTCAIDRKWNVYVNDDFYLKLGEDEALFVAAHEILHPVLSYFERGAALGIFDAKMQAKNPAQAIYWNIASDMLINTSLKEMGLSMPLGTVRIPDEYKGKGDSESIFKWLRKNRPDMVQEIEVSVGNGCGMMPDGDGAGENSTAGTAAEAKASGDDEIPSSQQMRNMIAEANRSMGKGHKLKDMFTPAPPQKENWKQLLKQAFSQVSNDPRHNDSTTFKRPKRRGGLRFPRYRSLDPSLAVVVDVSGSMDREWVREIVSKTRGLACTYPGVDVVLVVHTSQVHFADWINSATKVDKLVNAMNFSGGTAVEPAYEALKKMRKRVDALVHFTDMEVEQPWPVPPTRKLYVGWYSHRGETGWYSEPPRGTRILKCNAPEKAGEDET